MDSIISQLPTWAMAGAGAGGGYFVVLRFFEWLGGRVDKREAAVEARRAGLDASTQKIIKILEDRMAQQDLRLDRVEGELIECRASHAQCEAELTRLKAIMQGWGEAKDHAQTIIAAQRLIDKGAPQ